MIANRLCPNPWPLFLTWPTHGTWLPGDEGGGWVEHRHGWQLPDPARKREAQARLTEDACLLDQDQRRLVELTIADHCRVRGWTLYTVNCRWNHVHVIVAGDREPKEIREQFKAWCTRRLKALQQERSMSLSAHDSSAAAIRQKWWAERGSHHVNDEEGLEAGHPLRTRGTRSCRLTLTRRAREEPVVMMCGSSKGNPRRLSLDFIGILAGALGRHVTSSLPG